MAWEWGAISFAFSVYGGVLFFVGRRLQVWEKTQRERIDEVEKDTRANERRLQDFRIAHAESRYVRHSELFGEMSKVIQPILDRLIELRTAVDRLSEQQQGKKPE